MNPIIKSNLNRLMFSTLPGPQEGICRIRHDKECKRLRGPGKYPYLSRFYDPKSKTVRGLPETVRYNGENGNIVLTEEWQKFFEQNNTPTAQKYIKRLQSGWVNYGPWPKVEQLGFGGDYVVVYAISGEKAYIRSYVIGRSPESYTNENFLQQFGLAYTDDSISISPVGNAYTFPIAMSGGRLWVHVDDLTFVRPA